MAARTASANSKSASSDAAAARRSNRSFYEVHAERYAEVTLDLSMDAQLARFLELTPPGPIVDLGCGAGRDLKAMTRLGRWAFGLDLSRPLAGKAHDVSGAPVVVADLRRTPVASGALAGVWASASLLHLPRREVPRALAEAARLLKPGGVMFSSVKAGRGEHWGADGRWFVFHERSSWGRRIEEAGFRVISLEVSKGSATQGRKAEVWVNCLAMRS